MDLSKKKALASRALKVGKDRIIFLEKGMEEIQKAITRQDILDLYKEGVIQIKEKKGRRKNKKRKNQRKKGKIKKTINKRKQEYVKVTRKLRRFLKFLVKTSQIPKEKYRELRKTIKTRKFKSKRHLKESLKLQNG